MMERLIMPCRHQKYWRKHRTLIFDLNDPRNLSLLYTKEQWDAMSEEDQVEAMNDLWRNFCVSDAYEPGSTAKPFTVAAGLETGTLTGNESYYCGRF